MYLVLYYQRCLKINGINFVNWSETLEFDEVLSMMNERNVLMPFPIRQRNLCLLRCLCLSRNLCLLRRTWQIGDFCLVKFSASSKSEKVFLGQCTDIDDMENILKFSFLRSKGNDKKMFTFKANNDSWVDQHDVIEVLDAPVMNNRGRYTFSLAVPVME